MMESKVRELLNQAVDDGWKDWDKSSCHDEGCGCVTEWIKRRLEQALAGEGETYMAIPNSHPFPVAQAQNAPIPPLWRMVKCTKHEDYHSGCGLCEEEVLSCKLEKAYIAGRLAGMIEAEKVAMAYKTESLGTSCGIAAAIRAAATQRKGESDGKL